MKSFTKFLSLLFACGLISLLAPAQQPTPKPPAAPSPTPAADDRGGQVRISEVRVPVIVLDEKNQKQPVSGLTRGDFLVWEDKVPQQLTGFFDIGESSKLPVYVAVLMDTSPSTAGKLKFEKQAAKDFIYTVMKQRKDLAAFVTFDHEVRLLQDFTGKQDLLDKAIDGVNRTGTNTALYDAIWEICDQKMRRGQGQLEGGRRVIVVITDGEDTYSRARLDEAIDIANRTETIIFAVSTKAGFLGSVPGVTAGTVKDDVDKKLERLARETGGEVFFTGDMLALERAFKRISNELRSQYILTYKPVNDRYDGTERKIEVRLAKENGNYKVRAKQKYRAINDNVK